MMPSSNIAQTVPFMVLISCILNMFKGISPFKMHKIIFLPENLKKNLGFTSQFG